MLAKIDTFTLAGGTSATGRGANLDTARHQRGVQVFYPIAAPANTRDTGNDANELSFTVTREFETMREAELFLVDHPAEVPRRGLLQLVMRGEDGSETSRYLENAMCTTIERAQPSIGVTLTLRYSFIGGRYTKQKPTS